jgi:TfoX/Sxy family transcriptional regulator of competence genes
MPVSNEFLLFVLDHPAEWGGVTGRRMFGGAGL